MSSVNLMKIERKEGDSNIAACSVEISFLLYSFLPCHSQ